MEVIRQVRWDSVPVKPIWPIYKQLTGLEEVALRLAAIFNFVCPVDDALTS
jgi:hypothetical protein